MYKYRVVFLTGPPLKSSKYRKVKRFGVSRTIYVNVDSPNLGFTYFFFYIGSLIVIDPTTD